MRKTLVFLTLGFFLGGLSESIAQVNVNLIIRTPTPSSITEWEKDPSILQISIINSSDNDFPNAFFSFRIINEKGEVIAESNKNDRRIPRVNIPAGPPKGSGTAVFNGTQVINSNAITINEKIRSVVSATNSLPEGNYQACVILYDQNGNEISSFGESCGNFFVLIPDPPSLISPIEEASISNNFPVFTWTPVINAPPGTILKYKIKIAPRFSGQSYRDAIDHNPVLMEKNEILITNYQYMPSDPSFDLYPNAIGFVWQIQAFNQTGSPASRNEGKSEIGSFKLHDEIGNEIIVNRIYPVDGDTVPWNIPHFTAQFGPYSADIRSIAYTLRLRKEGTTVTYTNSRTLSFADGPQISQGLTSTEKARLIILNFDNMGAIPSWMNNLEFGSKYIWSADLEFSFANGTTKTATLPEGSFILGFKKPALISPKPDSLFKADSKITFKWSVPRPEMLNYANWDAITSTGFHAHNFYSTAQNKIKIEISKAVSFDSIYRSEIIQLPSSGNYRTGNNCDEFFAETTKEISAIADTGSYFWRVSYLDQNDIKYFSGTPRKIKITPISSQGCFTMTTQVPVNQGEWTMDKQPRFAVSIKPQIKKKSITGGRIKIWKMSDPTQNINAVKSGTPVLDSTFTGNEDSKIYAYSTDMNGFTRYDLSFINGDSNSITFTADSGASYVWNFRLEFKKDSIRHDGTLCDSAFAVSNDAVFKVLGTTPAVDSGSCPGDCYATAPTNTTISSTTYAKDSVLTIGKFKLKLITVTGGASSLSGEGSIDVPYLRAPILVEFNGIKVNTDNQVFQGEVFGKIVDGAPYSPSEGKDFAGVMNWTNEKIKSIHEYSSSLGRLVSGFAGSDPIGLPIGFDKEISGHQVVIGIVGMVFTPTQANLNAAMYVDIPELGPNVGFGLGAKNICFHKDGFSGSGRKILYLSQDFGYQEEGTWSFLFKAPTPTDSGTYAVWDCKGFQKLTIAAEVEMPRSWLKPYPDVDGTSLVKARFKAHADKSGTGWQWLASANLDKCEISGADGLKLEVQEMAFDFSTVRNPSGIIFPTNYAGDKTNNWKGFFIKRASIILPNELKTFDGDLSPTISITDVIINKTGFCASFQATNIIQYPRGNFGDWGASIDTIRIDIVNSSLTSGRMAGRFKIPISDSALVYSASLARSPSEGGGLRYQFLIQPKDTISADIWKAKLNLLPTSRIELGNMGTGSFVAQASLSGSFTLSGNQGGISKLGFKGVSFEGFKVMSVSPYIEKGNWSLASPQHSMSGFPVSINNLNIVTGDRGGRPGAGIQFTLAVNLQPGSNAISGATTLSVWGKLASGSGGQKFVFDGISLDSIGISASLGAVEIVGGVRLYNSHPTFGDGFRGVVQANFVNQIIISATAQFGSVNDFRYWYVDAKAIFSQGIPVFSGVGIYGFGGGAWYHMRKTGSEPNLSTAVEGGNPDASLTPGTSNSGYQYVPDNGTNFGFRAMVVVGTYPKPDAFNCDVAFEAEFLSGGGIGRISILGDGYMLCELSNRSKAKVTANVDMTYNFPERTFHGVFNVSINASPLTGGGQMVLHFAPDVWYIKIGEPSARMNINLSSWLRVDGYLMVGMNLPAPPSLPSEIESVLGPMPMTRNPALAAGNGFAFGASAGFDTGKQQFLIFYAQIAAMIGFDLALLNYGPGTTCEGMSGTIGVNGWYAMGQLYAYLAASIGIHVDLWFVKGNFEILSLQVAANLQGAGPNPTWVKGKVGGQYRILGGAIKGKCSFEFKKGEQCYPIVESPLERMDLISDINPTQGSNGVDVFIEPQIAMNFELNEPFELEEMDNGSGEPKIRTFRVKLRNLILKDIEQSQTHLGQTVVASDKFGACFSPHDALEGYKYYKFEATAYGEEYISGLWGNAINLEGGAIEQTVSSTFRTGAAPDVIPPNNVAYTYPLSSHKYFLQDECRNGVVKLKSGLPNLFIPREGFEMELIARFLPLDYNMPSIDVPFTYNGASKVVMFEIPQLMNSKAFYVQIIKKETIDGFVFIDPSQLPQGNWEIPQFTTVSQLTFSWGQSNLFRTQRKVSATKVKYGEKLLYVFYFKTSAYNTLQQKLNILTAMPTENPTPSGNFELHTAKWYGVEPFDYYDFSPHYYNHSYTTYSIGPIIKVDGSRRTSIWHNAFANSKVYDEITKMRNKSLWSGEVEYEKYQSPAYPSLNFVSVEFTSPSPNPLDLLAAFLGSGTTSGSGTTTSGSGTTTTTSFNIGQTVSAGVSLGATLFQTPPPPELRITYKQGIVVPKDFLKLKTKAVNIISSPFYFFSLPISDKNWLNTIISRNYQMMTNCNYELRFFYNYWGCRGVDDPPVIYTRFFTF